MQFIDPVTNMTNTNTSCDDVIELDVRTGKTSVLKQNNASLQTQTHTHTYVHL